MGKVGITMVLSVMQKEKGLYSAQFVIERKGIEIGDVDLRGKIGSKEARIRGTLCSTEFNMMFDGQSAFREKVFRPYSIQVEGKFVGDVCRKSQKDGIFKTFDYLHLEKNKDHYDMFPIGLGKLGGKNLIYSGNEQVAQIDIDCVIYDDIHKYKIFAVDEESSFISVLFCLYMYVIAGYKPGVKMSNSKVANRSVTTNKTLKGKYNPEFINSVSE